MSPTTVMYQTPQAVNHQVSSAATPVGGSSSFHAERYMHRAGVGLGITQIVLGIISVSTGIVLVLLPESYKHGAGIWCGFLANDIRGWSVFLIFVAFTEGVIAVISSAICCHGVCCCSEPSSQGTVIYTVPNNAQNTGAYMVPGQQGFVYYPQQGPQVGGYNAQPMYVQGPLASNIAQQQHQQQQQQQWPQQQPPQAQQQPVDGATGQLAGPLPQKQ